MVLNKILEDGSISEAELNDFHELCCILIGNQVHRKKRKRPVEKATRATSGALSRDLDQRSKKEPLARRLLTTAGFHVVHKQSVTKSP